MGFEILLYKLNKIRKFPFFYGIFLLVISIELCLASDGISPTSTSTSLENKRLPGMLVLEPVDLSNGKTAVKLGIKLREIFKKSQKWSVFSRPEIVVRYQDYNKDITTPCKEYTCAFDIANIFHTPYVMYSTFTRFKDLYAFNMVIIDVLDARITWSHTGEVLIKKGKNREESLIYMLNNVIGNISIQNFINTDIDSRGILGIINFNKKSGRSNIIADRLATHLTSRGGFDIMSQQELSYMTQNLKVHPTEFTSENMQSVGSELGLDFLIYSQLNMYSSKYKIRLALFDVQKKAMVRDWNFSNKQYRKILGFEKKFSASLNKSEANFSEDNGPPLTHLWKWVTSPALGLTSMGLMYAGLKLHKSANRDFNKYESANTLEELNNRENLEERINLKDGARNFLYTLSIISLSGSILLWTF